MMTLNDNILLKDLDWYENCIYKIEYVKFEVKELKKKERLNAYDQIKINTLLNVLNSPLEYAALQFYKKGNYGSNIPARKENSDDDEYRQKMKRRFKQEIDNELFNIFNNLIQNPYYKDLHKMNNDEKHDFINRHNKKVTKNTELAIYGGVVISNFTSVQNVNYDNYEKESIKSDIEPLYTTGEIYKEEFIFTMNNREVFQFLNDLILMVEKFVEDIKGYLSKK